MFRRRESASFKESEVLEEHRTGERRCPAGLMTGLIGILRGHMESCRVKILTFHRDL